MRKYFSAVVFLSVLLLSTLSFASVGVRLNGSVVGTATDINFVCNSGTNSVVTADGSTYNVNCSTALATTGMANGGAVSMATADTAVSTSYAFVRKAIAASANPGFSTGTLANGIPGQVLTIYITAVGSSGTWTLTPTTTTGFSSIKFTAAKDIATFLYVNDTTGWVILGYTGTITVTNSGT